MVEIDQGAAGMNRSGKPRDVLLIGTLLATLAVLTTAAALLESRPEQPIRLDSESSAPTGARALYLWLNEIGFETRNDVGSSFEVPAEADMVLLLDPGLATSPTEEDISQLQDWVAAGGVLVFASENPAFDGVAEAFGFSPRYLDDPAEKVLPTIPLFTDPALTGPVSLSASAYFETERTDFIPLAAVPEGPVVAAALIGQGRLILSTGSEPFTNAGLKTPGSAAFILNLAAGLPEGAVIWFDEWHHGRRDSTAGSGGPGAWLRATPAGRAVLFASGILFAWIVLSGRAFGRTQSLKTSGQPRAPLEYVSAIANLNRSAGNRADLLAHYHRQYKRRLGRRYHADAALPDDEFIISLRRSAPETVAEEAAALLKELRRPDLTEAELVERISKSAHQQARNTATIRSDTDLPAR